MKNKIFISFRKWLGLSLLPLFASGCLYEHPELTADGEVGVDPTEVNVTADFSLNLKVGDKDATRINTRAESGYRHRFIIDAYLDRALAARQVVYKELTDADQLTVTANMKLHARNYQLVVWADYVKTDSEEGLYYNTKTLNPVLCTEPYQGNTEYKDALYAGQALDLSEYRDQWNVRVPVKLELKRPVARYELIANDVDIFLKRIAEGKLTGNKFTAIIKYDGYQPTGFNALDGVAKNSLMYMQYARTITLPAEGTKEMTTGFDYPFVINGEADVPITVEITDATNAVVARTRVKLPCVSGKQTIVRSNFLTADPDGGIGFDTDFGGKIEIDLGDL